MTLASAWIHLLAVDLFAARSLSLSPSLLCMCVNTLLFVIKQAGFPRWTGERNWDPTFSLSLHALLSCWNRFSCAHQRANQKFQKFQTQCALTTCTEKMDLYYKQHIRNSRFFHEDWYSTDSLEFHKALVLFARTFSPWFFFIITMADFCLCLASKFCNVVEHTLLLPWVVLRTSDKPSL